MSTSATGYDRYVHGESFADFYTRNRRNHPGCHMLRGKMHFAWREAKKRADSRRAASKAAG